VSLTQWVPWVIFLGNAGSLMLTMRMRVSGFYVLIAAQAVFAWYAVETNQLGFIAQNVIMTAVAINGIRLFKTREQT
jgi:hypothetical protein